MWQVLSEIPGVTVEKHLTAIGQSVYFCVDQKYLIGLAGILDLLRVAGETDDSVRKSIVRYLGSSSIWGDASLCDGG